ncbi:hypothetical protein [Dactylosporangium sp. CA-233914]|uniref:hypothetical protein n=1 Tax=Dactylosporangium sp. CA-233914 TaxID=3239934 RepID=UPI003D909627
MRPATALGGNVGQVNCAVAEAGVTGLTEAPAKEWGRYNVTVNTVAFGLIHALRDGLQAWWHRSPHEAPPA